MLIGIGGKKGSGKNAFSSVFIEAGFIEFSFAEFLKRGIREIYGFTEKQLWGDKKEEIDQFWGIKPREVMQWIGTDIMREKDSDFWVKRFRKWYSQEYDRNKNFIITDVRFINETEEIKKLGGILIWIERGLGGDTHISENSVDKSNFDIEIENIGDITSLRKKGFELLHILQ